MPIYTMEVVTQVLTIVADNEEQAEAKYDAYFDSNEACPCGVVNCDCVDDSEDIYHITTEQEPDELNCGACGQFTAGLIEDHWLECDENPENISNDDNANPDNHFVAPKENDSIESN